MKVKVRGLWKKEDWFTWDFTNVQGSVKKDFLTGPIFAKEVKF